MLLSDLEYHRILELKETFRDHLIQFNIGGCSTIFLVCLSSCIGCTTAKASKQIFTFIPLQSNLHQQLAQLLNRSIKSCCSLHETHWRLLLTLSHSTHTIASGSSQPLAPALTSQLIPSCTKGLATFLIQGLCAWSFYCLQGPLNSSLLIPCSHDQVHLGVSFKKQNKTETLLGGASFFNIPPLNSIFIFAFFIVHMPMNNYFTFFWSAFPPRL